MAFHILIIILTFIPLILQLKYQECQLIFDLVQMSAWIFHHKYYDNTESGSQRIQWGCFLLEILTLYKIVQSRININYYLHKHQQEEDHFLKC